MAFLFPYTLLSAITNTKTLINRGVKIYDKKVKFGVLFEFLGRFLRRVQYTALQAYRDHVIYYSFAMDGWIENLKNFSSNNK